MALVHLQIRLLVPKTALKAIRRLGKVYKENIEGQDVYILCIRPPRQALTFVNLFDGLLLMGEHIKHLTEKNNGRRK